VIVVYHNHGVGGGGGPVNYLLGEDRNRDDAELLRGDPESIVEEIDSLKFNKKYTSGLLSINETNLSEEAKNKIMDDFEKATFCGMEPDQYSIMWVQHMDKKNLELNFVIPNVEHRTGKRLQPYYHAADKNRINDFRDIQNIKYDLRKPDSPEHRQSLMQSKSLPTEKKAFTKALDRHFLKMIDQRAISDRTDIISSLKDIGLEIARETDKSISIVNPNGGQNIRLKGAIYERTFRNTQEAREQRQRAIKDYEKGERDRYPELCKRHQESLRKRSETNKQKYRQSDKELSQSIGIKSIPADISHDLHHIDNNHSVEDSSREGHKEDRGNKDFDQGIPDSPGKNKSPGHMGDRLSGMERGGQSIDSPSRNESKPERKVHEKYQSNSTNTDRGIDYDRDRKDFNERFGRLRERARNTAKSIRRGISSFAGRIRHTSDRIRETVKREQSYSREPRSFGQQIGHLDKAIKKEQAIGYSPNIGRGMGRG